MKDNRLKTKQIQGGRRSNLELYRIVCMLMIVAHHFVVNSGLMGSNSPMDQNPTNPNTIYLFLYGMWGKTGINCFLMITGYFMCTSTITLRKFIKLLLWIYVYQIAIFVCFLASGYEHLNTMRIVQLIMPVWGFNSNFTSCFIMFWLTIPFWNILIHNMSRHQHELLLILLVTMYSVLCNIPRFDVVFNYVTWFGVIYLVASYIRIYPRPLFENKKTWCLCSFISIILSIASVVILHLYSSYGAYAFVADSNRPLALAVSVSTFLFFKNMVIPYSKIINTIGASTFGVLLIHANSDAMRQWLWKDTVDCIGHYSLPFWQLVGYSIGVVLLIFFTCIFIDRVRVKLIEEPFFRWYDKKPRFQKLIAYLRK